jgi:cytochrome bd ubiquinol oxidase subunit II
VVVAFFILLVSVWTPAVRGDVAARWFSWPNIGFLASVPIATVAAWLGLWKALVSKHDSLPYFLALVLFALGLLGLCASVFPYAVPYQLTIWDAASRPETLTITGIGLAFWLPVVMTYLAFSYWTFRGKVSKVDDYS